MKPRSRLEVEIELDAAFNCKLVSPMISSGFFGAHVGIIFLGFIDWFNRFLWLLLVSLASFAIP